MESYTIIFQQIKHRKVSKNMYYQTFQQQQQQKSPSLANIVRSHRMLQTSGHKITNILFSAVTQNLLNIFTRNRKQDLEV